MLLKKKNIITTEPERATRNLLLICDCKFMFEKCCL